MEMKENKNQNKERRKKKKQNIANGLPTLTISLLSRSHLRLRQSHQPMLLHRYHPQ